MHVYLDFPFFSGIKHRKQLQGIYRFQQWDWPKILDLWCHMTICTLLQTTVFQLWAVSKIVSRTFYTGRNMCHRRVYLMWLVCFCTLVRLFIYSFWFVRLRFRIFCVPLNFHLMNFRFWKICDPVILQSTSEASIWFSTVTSNTFIFWGLCELKDELNFLFTFPFICCLKNFSWVRSFTTTEFWARKFALSVALTELSKF